MPSFPLDDELFVSAWAEYVIEAQSIGVCSCLRSKLVQMNYPIQPGMSQDESYLAATRRGILPFDSSPLSPPSPLSPLSPGLFLHSPASLSLSLHPTPAGHIPVLLAPDRQDFISLVQALTGHNEPIPVPDSMGALLVSGYNNWDRIRRLRLEWESNHSSPDPAPAWSQEFQRIRSQPSLYQDRFILLTHGPYSAVPASSLGLSEDEWIRLSFVLRLDHECTHYLFARILGPGRATLLEELLADFSGLLKALGRYESSYALSFLGLEDESCYRKGGRLQNYKGDLAEDAFKTLQSTVRRAIFSLEHLCRDTPTPLSPEDKASLLLSLSKLTLEDLANA